MKRPLGIFAVLCAGTLLLTSCTSSAPPASASQRTAESSISSSASSQAITFTDSLGHTITLQEQPQRVAALIGSYAETWLLAGGEVIAVTQDAYDERGLDLPEDTVNVGGNLQPDLEALFAAQPDFVILSPDLDGQLALQESLASAGIPAAYFKVESFDDYLDMLRIFTNITGRPDLYEKNGTSIQSSIEQTIASVPQDAAPSVLLLRAYSTGVRAKNSDNIAGQMIADLGGVNLADSDSNLLEDLQMESILAADPDFILVTTMGSSTQAALDSLDKLMNSDPAWQTLTAVQEDRVVVLPKDLFHYKPNSRWAESYEMLFEVLYGEPSA